MAESVRQQLIISGVGGQGVLFVTRLLAEAAIKRDLPVFTSETHGMAQRGGTVVSHFKVGDFASPLIRNSQADGLLVLKPENIAQHGRFLKSGGWVVVNADGPISNDFQIEADTVDADALAREMGAPKSVNLMVLGFSLAKSEKRSNPRDSLFCSLPDIKAVIEQRFADNRKMLDASLQAIDAGYREGS
jgi:indolepyruvate ferredoxin oxidoreductase beta subunit